MTSPIPDDASDEEPADEHPADGPGHVWLWIAVFLVMLAGAFVLGQFIEELTGKKPIARIAVIAVAFMGTMLARGGVWLCRRLTGTSTTKEASSSAEPTTNQE